jgi:hypothetical protein
VVLRCRFLILALVVTSGAVRLYELRFSDFLYFEYFGRTALHRPHFGGGWASLMHVYANYPTLQVGPPALFAAIPIQLLPPRAANEAAVVVMALCLVACLYLLERVARDTPSVRRPSPGFTLLAGFAIMPMWLNLSALYLHLDDVLIFLLALAAVCAVVQQSWLGAAVCLGTATAIKPWAIAIVPVLFALHRVAWWKAGLACVLMFLVWWAPFWIADHDTFVALAHGNYPIHAGSSWALFGVDGQHDKVLCRGELCLYAAYAWMRPLQFLISFALAAVAVSRGRWLAAPLVGLLGRVLLDAQVWPYYGVGPVLMALLLDITARRRLPVLAALVTVAEYSYVVVDNSSAIAIVRLVIGAGVIGGLLRPGRAGQPTDGTDTGRPAARNTDDGPVAETIS